MKKGTRMFMVAITVIVMMITVVGCGKKEQETVTETPTQKETPQAQDKTAQVEEETSLKVAAEPFDIWWLDRSDVDSADPIVKAKDEELVRQVKEKFNVNLIRERVSQTNYREKLNLLIASGDYPDIVSNSGFSNIAEAIDAGLLLPLDSILETDENWKTVDRSLFQSVTFGGSVYSLISIIGKPDGIFYRQDWLENVGLPVPKTVDDMYNVLKAFTFNDPDKNGKDDTFGLSIAADYSQGGPVFKMFTIEDPTTFSDGCFYYDEATQTVKNVYYDVEDMKEALTWLNKLYEEGILNPEFVVTNKKQAEEIFLSGKAGAWVEGVQFISGRQRKIQDAFPEGKIMSFEKIATKYGSNYDYKSHGAGSCLTNAVGENAEIAKQVLAYIDGPEAVKIAAIGVEGAHYKMENGAFTWIEEEAKKQYNAVTLLTSPFAIELPVPDELLSASIATADGIRYSRSIQSGLSETFTKNGADIAKIMQEGITLIIMGEKPLDHLDEMIKEFDKLGVPEICKEIEATLK